MPLIPIAAMPAPLLSYIPTCSQRNLGGERCTAIEGMKPNAELPKPLSSLFILKEQIRGDIERTSQGQKPDTATSCGA
jgi:hypothetical protein